MVIQNLVRPLYIPNLKYNSICRSRKIDGKKYVLTSYIGLNFSVTNNHLSDEAKTNIQNYYAPIIILECIIILIFGESE